MGQQIIKQPNGYYAVFSSVVDNFVILDATPQEIIDEWIDYERKRLTERVNQIVKELDSGGKPYYQFTMTWDEANALIREVYGTKE